MNVFNRMLLNAAKFQGYSFYQFWVIKGKPTGGDGKVTPRLPHPNQIRVKDNMASLLHVTKFIAFFTELNATLRDVLRTQSSI